MAPGKKDAANITNFLTHGNQNLETQKGKYIVRYIELPLSHWDDDYPCVTRLNT